MAIHDIALHVTDNPLPEAIEAFVAEGDIAKLTKDQRIVAYRTVCDSLGLNYLTRPLDVIKDDSGKMRFYYRKEAADQLAKIHGISFKTVGREWIDEETYCVTVEAHARDGRSVDEVGIVPIAAKVGPQVKANLLMKAQTKARRRATMALVGLGWNDVEDTNQRGVRAVLDPVTGALADGPAMTALPTAPRDADAFGERPDVAAIAKAEAQEAASPEAMEHRERQALLAEIKNVRMDYGIALNPFLAWIAASEKRTPLGLHEGMLQASNDILRAILAHLHLYEGDAGDVLLGETRSIDDPDDEAFVRAMTDDEQPPLPGTGASEAETKTDAQY